MALGAQGGVASSARDSWPGRCTLSPMRWACWRQRVPRRPRPCTSCPPPRSGGGSSLLANTGSGWIGGWVGPRSARGDFKKCARTLLGGVGPWPLRATVARLPRGGGGGAWRGGARRGGGASASIFCFYWRVLFCFWGRVSCEFAGPCSLPGWARAGRRPGGRPREMLQKIRGGGSEGRKKPPKKGTRQGRVT